MPLRELFGKTIGFGLTAAALAGGGILVLVGDHAFNDYFNILLGWGLVLLALLTAGYGSFAILAILYDARSTKAEHQVHITPRAGAPEPPPPWGMGDIGRPGGGVVDVSGSHGSGGGAPLLMAVHTSNIDGAMLVVGLLAWTLLTVVFFAPGH
ncbi:MAG: hypothetical protein ACREN2_00185 [Candidatus Dormibacteria bacterium]